MAIDKNVFLGTALTTFAISMVVASGPYGLAFGAALMWSSFIALALTIACSVVLEGSKNMKQGTNVTTPVTIHTSKPAPVLVHTPSAVVHTRHFEPAHSQVRTPAAVVHTQQFVPAQTQVQTPAAVVHTQQFLPKAPPTHIAPPPGTRTHTRHFEPAAKPATTVHTQQFVPAGTPITPSYQATAAAANAARAARHQASPAAHPPGVKVSSVFVPRKNH